MKFIQVEFGSLSKYERMRTPKPFARWLVSRVRKLCRVWHVAALWVMEDSVYKEFSGVHCWDVKRDAGVIEHPADTRLFPQFAPDLKIEYVDQCEYGFRCRKRTALAFHRIGG